MMKPEHLWLVQRAGRFAEGAEKGTVRQYMLRVAVEIAGNPEFSNVGQSLIRDAIQVYKVFARHPPLGRGWDWDRIGQWALGDLIVMSAPGQETTAKLTGTAYATVRATDAEVIERLTQVRREGGGSKDKRRLAAELSGIPVVLDYYESEKVSLWHGEWERLKALTREIKREPKESYGRVLGRRVLALMRTTEMFPRPVE